MEEKQSYKGDKMKLDIHVLEVSLEHVDEISAYQDKNNNVEIRITDIVGKVVFLRMTSADALHLETSIASLNEC